jgi:hypothetical protein
MGHTALWGPKKIFFSAFFSVSARWKTLKLQLNLLHYILRRLYQFKKNSIQDFVGASDAILDFGGPVSPEPAKSQHSNFTETCTFYAPVLRSNLPVVSIPGFELFRFEVFAPKFFSQATALCRVPRGLPFSVSMLIATEHLSH